jgi:hypothetical protein
MYKSCAAQQRWYWPKWDLWLQNAMATKNKANRMTFPGTSRLTQINEWPNKPALVAHTGTGGEVSPALVAQCVKGLLPR